MVYSSLHQFGSSYMILNDRDLNILKPREDGKHPVEPRHGIFFLKLSSTVVKTYVAFFHFVIAQNHQEGHQTC